MEKSCLGVKYVNLQVTYFLPVSSCIIPQNFSSLSPLSQQHNEIGYSFQNGLADSMVGFLGEYACKNQRINKNLIVR